LDLQLPPVQGGAGREGKEKQTGKEGFYVESVLGNQVGRE
jgi:hypothetical protein